jgi:ubiquinone/menaquinone biosynthesis C-methylase UbiE
MYNDRYHIGLKMAIKILNTLLWVLGIFTVWQILLRVGRKILNFPAPAFIGRFLDSDLRRRIQPPEPLIKRSGIKKGMRVLEIGCGSGAYTTFVARAVGSTGSVEALDIQPAMLSQLEKKLSLPEYSDVTNIQTHLASAYELPFDDGSIDLVYIIAVLFEIPDRAKALAEIKRVLKPGGILAVTEFLPDPDYPLRKTVARLGTSAGFNVDDILGNFWTYTVRLKKY